MKRATVRGEPSGGGDRTPCGQSPTSSLADGINGAREPWERGRLELDEHSRFILDHLPIILWSSTPDGRITMSEGRGLKLLGLRPGELVGNSVFDLVQEVPDMKEQLLRVLDGETVVGTRRIRDRWHEYYFAPCRGSDGAITSMLGVSMDTTEGRQAGLARRQSESRLRAVLAHAPMILWAVDREGRVTLSEGKGLSALGLQPGEGIGKNAFDIPVDTPMHGLKQALEGAPYVGEMKLANPPLWYDTRCEPLRDPSGKHEGAIVVSIDITGRKQAEQERDRLLRAARRALLGERAARRRANFLAQASRVLAGSLDQDTTLLSIAHLVVPEIADGCVVDIVDDAGTRHPVVAYRDPEREAELAEIARRMGGLNTVVDRIHAGGEPFFEPRLDAVSVAKSLGPAAQQDLLERLGAVSIVVVGMRARGRTLGCLSLFTVPESGRRLEADDVELASDLAVHAALAIDNARLYGEQTLAVQRRDEFLSVASHELRTPVTSLQLAVQALTRQRQRSVDGTTPPAVLTNMLQTAERQCKRLAQLVENLLDVSRIATGQLAMNLDRVDLAEVVRETAAGLAVEVAQAGCALELAVDLPVVGNWDRVRLEQVVTNLLSNAVKYGKGKPVGLSVEIDETVARLRVEDHGIGIALDSQQSIFERFERAVSARHYGGFGLGLYIVKQIVTALGGNITVESEPAAGAAFIVTLPLSGPSRASEGPRCV